ncbi:MAG: GHMP kinase [Saprospiraceae bacterium]|nr:GHMP kinase [Saprospiraceae bacterium]
MHGATVLALPTKLGQRMKMQELTGSEVIWTSYDHQGKKWFDAEIDLMQFDITSTSDERTGKFLKKIFKACINNNSEFLSHWKKYKVEHYLEFPIDWGLGSSSTLIYNMASWADVNPYHLYFDLETGSGYDVACAGADGPILYSLKKDSLSIDDVDFNPVFEDQLYFLPLGIKVDSRTAVKKIQNNIPDKNMIRRISELSEKVLELKSLKAFENWVEEHENTVSDFIKEKTIKSEKFSDFWGSVKSLGSWHGDMVLVTSDKSEKETFDYFLSKGMPKLIPFRELVL